MFKERRIFIFFEENANTVSMKRKRKHKKIQNINELYRMINSQQIFQYI